VSESKGVTFVAIAIVAAILVAVSAAVLSITLNELGADVNFWTSIGILLSLRISGYFFLGK
jgi:hypothetical protein